MRKQAPQIGLTYFTAMGVEPLTTWVVDEIKKLKI